MLHFFRQLEPCLVAMEACGSAHYWARELMVLGHEVRLIAPQFVKPYVKSGKNDANDAEAICEAASRPNMRFVPVKTVQQQACQAVHRIRSRLVKARTALSNEIRGLLAEFGLIASCKGIAATRRLLQEAQTKDDVLPGELRNLLQHLQDELDGYDRSIERLEVQLQQQVRNDERVQRIMEVEGIGPITATAIVAAVGDARQFSSGRQFAAWLGLVPRQHSSGGKALLGAITKRGDTYLRTLLVHGARSVIQHLGSKEGTRCDWLRTLLCRRSQNVVTVALANKNARIIWAILSRNEGYRPA